MIAKIRARLLNASIRTKYLVAVAALVVMLLSCGLYIAVNSYRSTYTSTVDSVRTSFQSNYAELKRFEDRLNHLATLFQSDSTIISMLAGSQSYSTYDYQHARQDLLPKLYSMLDGSEDYFCRLYVDSSLDLSDRSSRILMLNDVLDEPWASESLEGWGWRRFYSAQALGEKDPALIVPIRRLDDYQTLVAMLRIDIRQSALQRMLELAQGSGYALCYLETADGQLIAASGEAGDYTSALSENEAAGFESFEFNQLIVGKDTVFHQRLARSGWRLVAVVRHDALSGAIISESSFTFLVALVFVMVGMLCALPILWWTTYRIRRFSQHVQRYNRNAAAEDHITPPRLESTGEDEIGLLINEHNAMLDRIDALVQEKTRSEEERRQLELSALQAQIKPHFLYNTLEAITWMARMNQPDKVEDTIFNLTRFYRLCLSSGCDVLPLSQELEIVRHYFAIAGARYETQYALKIDVAAEALDCQLPKITLQPLVENALMHGLMEADCGEGEVHLFTRQGKQGLELCIADTGGHFARETWEQVMSGCHSPDEHAGYGLRNVEKRLCLFFRREQVLQLEHTQGTTTIVLPLN